MNTTSLPEDISSSPPHRAARILFWSATTLSGVLQAWAWRYAITSDGIAYLDIADRYARHDWRAAVNAYWSPLYSWILAAAFQIFHPSALGESSLVHGVNFLILIVAAACFEFLLESMVAVHSSAPAGDSDSPLPVWAFQTLGYFLFLWTTLKFTPVTLVTPDLLVTALTFLSAGLLVRMKVGKVTVANCAALGGVLGMAYLAKTIMLPIGAVFLAAGLIAVPGLRKSPLRFFVAVAMFVLVCAPFVTAISRAKGRFTVGDSAKINYAEFVDGVDQFVHWQGEGTAGRPLHPTRKLLEAPPLYEFAAPVAGSYPPWFDPSYWYDGVAPRFNAAGQWNVLIESLRAYLRILGKQEGLLLVLLALVLAGGRFAAYLRRLVDQGPLIFPSWAALVLYGLIHVSMRYVGVFLVLGWLACFAALRLGAHAGSKMPAKFLTLALAILMGAGIAAIDAANLARAFLPRPHVAWEVAHGLRQMGLRPGDKVAFIGYGLGAYWPRLAGVKIVAEIPAQGEAEFWDAHLQIQQQVFRIFADTGAKVAVAYQRGVIHPTPGWRALGPTGYFAYPLSQH